MSHVHFGDVQDHREIGIALKKDASIAVNFGFLQDNHIYNIRLELPTKMAESDNIEAITSDPAITIEHAKSSVDEGQAVLTLSVKLQGIHGQQHFSVQLNHTEPPTILSCKSNILKSYEGTPSLKNGITISARLDNDDNSSVASGDHTLITAS